MPVHVATTDKPQQATRNAAIDEPARGGRLSATHWAQAALDLIAEQGIAAVAVEPLARRMQQRIA